MSKTNVQENEKLKEKLEKALLKALLTAKVESNNYYGYNFELPDNALEEALQLIEADRHRAVEAAEIRGLSMAHYCVETGSPEEKRINNAIEALKSGSDVNQTPINLTSERET
jgi:hypothetical protein